MADMLKFSPGNVTFDAQRIKHDTLRIFIEMAISPPRSLVHFAVSDEGESVLKAGERKVLRVEPIPLTVDEMRQCWEWVKANPLPGGTD